MKRNNYADRKTKDQVMHGLFNTDRHKVNTRAQQRKTTTVARAVDLRQTATEIK